MLEQLFGSKTRVRLLRLLLNNPTRPFFVRELSRRVGAQINAVRNEIETLTKLGLLAAAEVADDETGDDEVGAGRRRSAGQRKYFRVDTESVIYPELRDLFLKSRTMLEKDLVQKLTATGTISYLAFSGYFVGEKDAPTDILIVGKVNREKVVAVIHAFEREVGREIDYTILTPQEYKYRREVTDRFLFSILESRKRTLVDTMNGQVSV